MEFGFFLSSNKSGSIETASSLLSSPQNEFESCISFLSDGNDSDCGFDAFGGKDLFGNPDFSNMDASMFTANASNIETVGSVASSSIETIGSMACASAETAGSVACASVGGDCGSSGVGGFSSFC